MRASLLALSLAFALVGVGVGACTLPVAPPTELAKSGPQAGAIQGRVMVPASVIATGGGNVISTGGGNIIATGGMNFRLLAIAEQPLAHTEVFLADEAGQPIPGFPSVQTDAEGNYKLPGAPTGRTMVVAARLKTPDQKSATLQTLVKTSDLGVTADVSAATTMVTAAVTQKGDALAKFNPATFRTAVEATGKHLKDGELPDFADRTAILKKINELAAEIQEIKDAIAEIKQELQAIKKDLAEIKDLLKKKQGESGTGGTPAEPGSTDNPCAGSFRWLDQDGSGGISTDEWLALASDGWTEEELVYGFQAADTNYDGLVSLQEITAAWCGLAESDGDAPATTGGTDGDANAPQGEPDAGGEGGTEADSGDEGLDLGLEADTSVDGVSLDVSL